MSQAEFQFSGYVINFSTYQRIDENISEFFRTDNSVFSNFTRLRLRPTYYTAPRTRIALEYEITALLQSSLLAFGEPTERTNRQLVNLHWTPIEEAHFVLTHFIDRLYLWQDFDLGTFIIGRQRIAWGSGRIWNPTDMFNPINPANFNKIEKDGADAVSLKLYLGNFTDLQFVYNPADEFRLNNGAVRFRSNFKTYDFSIMTGYFDQRIIIGGDFAGNVFKAGFRGEAILSANEKQFSSNFVKYIFGLDYQFNPKFYGLVEYHYNGEGQKDKQDYELERLLAGEILNLNKSYLYLLATYFVHPLISSSFGYNANLIDGSGFVNGIATLSLSENLYANLGLLFPYAGGFDEYWYYSKAIYLSIEYYF